MNDLGKINSDGTFDIYATEPQDVKRLIVSVRESIKSATDQDKKHEYRNFLKFILKNRSVV